MRSMHMDATTLGRLIRAETPRGVLLACWLCKPTDHQQGKWRGMVGPVKGPCCYNCGLSRPNDVTHRHRQHAVRDEQLCRTHIIAIVPRANVLSSQQGLHLAFRMWRDPPASTHVRILSRTCMNLTESKPRFLSNSKEKPWICQSRQSAGSTSVRNLATLNYL